MIVCNCILPSTTGRLCSRCDAASRRASIWPQPYPTPLVPPDQAWFVDTRTNTIVVKVVNIGTALRPEEV
jgi:hypothetical protein